MLFASFKMFIIFVQYFMENKKEIGLKDFMSNGWNHVNLLTFTKSFDEKQHLAKRNVIKEILNQDFNHSSANETEKYNIEDIEAVRINKLLYTEKTKIIINGNLLYVYLYNF